MNSEIKINKQGVEAILIKAICETYNIKKEEVINYSLRYSDEFVVEFTPFVEYEAPAKPEDEEQVSA